VTTKVSSAAPTVRLAQVSKCFGRHEAVRDVDLTLHAGECVGLVGHNGAGKSTMIKMMLGLIAPTSGRVETLGENPSAGAAARARLELGYLPENVALYPSMTGEETLAFYARLKRQPVARNAALLERVGIAHAARRRVGTYSKGMRQRLALAQALLGSPRVLLLDEPTTGLDPALRQSFYEIVRGLRDGGATVLLSSHALAELEGQVDRVVVMNRGRKVADGTLAELRRLAGVPVRVRVRLASELRVAANDLRERWGAWHPAGDRMLEIACDESEKVAVLRSLAGLPGTIVDVDVLQPSLDDIYARFLQREEDGVEGAS
jgi:Cu-processing system ATP-binding protein